MRDLRARLGVILALALLPLLVFSIWKSYSDYTRDQAMLRSNTDLTARIALSEIVNSFKTTQTILRFKSTLLSGENCVADLKRLTNEYPQLYNVVQADATGRILCSAKPIRTNGAQVAAIVSQLSEDKPFITQIFKFPSPDGEPETVIATVYGVYEEGQLLKIYAAVEDIEFLSGLLKKSKILDHSDLAVFNASGEILVGDWAKDDLKTIAQNLPTRQLKGRIITEDKDGHPLLVIPTPSDQVYLAVASQRQKFVSWNKLNPLTSAIIPILAWLFGFAAIWLSTDQLILTHLRRMRTATAGFAQGNRNVRVGKLKNPPPSIGALGKNFDNMANRIVEREDTIKDSLAEKETLLREIHHRVKNNLQIIISLLNMQERKLKDKEGLAAIIDTRSRINAIALVHRGLYESTDLRFVEMETFLNRLLPELSLALGLKKQDISISTHADCRPLEADVATPIALFIVEAITNAVKHGVSEGGTIIIAITQEQNRVQVSVKDSGEGLSETAPQISGTGTKLMKGFARQLGGKVETRQDEDGYEVSLRFTLRNA